MIKTTIKGLGPVFKAAQPFVIKTETMTQKDANAMAKDFNQDMIVLSNGSVFHHTDQGLALARKYAKKFALTIYFVKHRKKQTPQKTN